MQRLLKTALRMLKKATFLLGSRLIYNIKNIFKYLLKKLILIFTYNYKEINTFLFL